MLLHMSTRIQVVVEEAEREAFRAQAEREGVSLSAWLREAGHRRLRDDRPRLDTVESVRAFFDSRPAREGDEPGWEEQKEAISRSRTAGLPPP
jgi:hypothetical protein